MLALQKPTSRKTCTPNILPCRISQTGPAKVTKRFWSPTNEKDDTQTAYFRGRRLRGRKIKVPEGYEGVIAKQSDKLAPTTATPVGARSFDDDEDEDEDDEEKPEPVKMLDVAATFDNIVVWGHDVTPAADDVYVKGIEEWIAFAQAIHEEPAEGK